MATPPESVEIYCLKCRAKTGSRDVEQVTMKNGRPALRAVCTVCGTGKYRIGSAVASKAEIPARSRCRGTSASTRAERNAAAATVNWRFHRQRRQSQTPPSIS